MISQGNDCASAAIMQPIKDRTGKPVPGLMGDVMPERDQATHDALVGKTLMAMPFARALSMQLADIGGGAATLTMPYAADLIGDPDTGVVHGGAVSALLDTCAGAAVLCHPGVKTATATLNLRIDYMRPAAAGQTITAQATCYHVTRTVAFVRATAHDEDSERPVAMASGAFTIQQTAMG